MQTATMIAFGAVLVIGISALSALLLRPHQSR